MAETENRKETAVTLTQARPEIGLHLDAGWKPAPKRLADRGGDVAGRAELIMKEPMIHCSQKRSQMMYATGQKQPLGVATCSMKEAPNQLSEPTRTVNVRQRL